jgi:parallel beta-helix repeat protein
MSGDTMRKHSYTLVIIAALLASILVSAIRIQPVKASGTTYIRPDGSLDPSTTLIQREGNTYTLTGNISSNADGIVIQRDNITLDGATYTLQGSSVRGFTGIFITRKSNLAIKNICIRSFYDGIWLDSSSNSSITGNTITGNEYNGIYLHSCMNTSVTANTITASATHGIRLDSCQNSHILNNTITGDNVYGIILYSSSGTSIAANTITANTHGCGIRLYSSSDNNVARNTVTKNLEGIDLDISSNNNSVFGNTITENHDYGIMLDYSSNGNNVVGNNVTDNGGSIYIHSSSDNIFYHNNFAGNMNISCVGSTSVWDNGYPYGGNFWSDYEGTDLHWGTLQNETGSDGIGDVNYVIDVNNIDRFPLMNPTTLFIGDVTRDGYVGIDDLFTVALHFGSEIGQQNYSRICDIDNDGYVGIDDLYKVASHFGEENP